jgi:hypothetical protein
LFGVFMAFLPLRGACAFDRHCHGKRQRFKPKTLRHR